MSEKRFFSILADDEYTLIQEKGNLRATYLKYSEVVDLLNEQEDKITELEIELTDCKNRKEQSEYNLRRENELLPKDNQRQKTLKNKHWREIQARENAYNRIISSLEDIIPQPMIEELRNAPLLDCDYEGVESNE